MAILFSPKAGIFFRLRALAQLWLALIIFSASPLWAESNLKISGQVTDPQSGQPLSGAIVRVVETGTQTTTDWQGNFFFFDLPAGNRVLKIERPPYQTQKFFVKIPVDGYVQLEVRLEPLVVTGPPVVVTPDWGDEPASSPNLALTPADWQESKHLSVAQFLSRQAGMEIKTSGVFGSTEEITIRGGAANQVLVILDGRPLNSNLGGTVDLSVVPLASLEKIEVYKGSQTARFGPDAVAGAIVMTSKKPEPKERLSPRLEIETGSFGYQSTVLESNLSAFDNVAGNLFYQNLSSIGDFSYEFKNKGRQRANSYVWTNRISGVLRWKHLESSFFWGKSRRGLPGDVLNLAPNGNGKDERHGATLNFDPRFNSGWFLQPSLGWEKLTQNFKLPDGFIKSDVRYRSEKKKAEAKFGRRFENQIYQWSTDFLESSLQGEDFVRPSQSLGKTTRRSGGVSLLADRRVLLNSFLTSGIFGAIRADWTGFTSPVYSPLFSGTMNFDKKIRFRLFGSWGKSFRLPTLDALFWKEDVFAAGNPRLLPERAESREAGYRILVPVFGKIRWEQTFFHNDLKNLIVWQRRADGKFTPENVSRAKIFGREEKAGWRLPKILELEFNHIQTEPKNESDFVLHDGKQLVFRPRHVYNANLTAAQNMVSLNLSGRWVGKRFTRAENTKYLPPYETYDASFAFSPKIRKRTWNFSLSVENFTDRRYEIPELYPMPGRSYRLALEIKW